MTKIISYIHLLACIGLSIFIFCVVLMTDPELIIVFFAVLAITVSGIYLFIIGRKKQPEDIKTSNLTKIISYFHLLGCIGWSIFLFWSFMEGKINLRDNVEIFVFSALFAPTVSGIYLFIVRSAIWRQFFIRLWKAKRLTILWTGIFIIVVMCLFPPFVSNSDSERHCKGYAFLFSDIISVLDHEGVFGNTYESVPAHIDLVRLIIQCAIVGLITGALLYTLDNKKSETGEK
jgi:hypothetical protein